MDEFSLIDCIVSELGSQAKGPWIALGPGDDAAVIVQSPGCQAVASIDTLIADRHFPAAAPAELVGYRALMVSLSDLAAMAAVPRYALVALTLPSADKDWVVSMARGMADAARLTGIYVCGGNLSRGALSITVSVHGEVPLNGAVTRSGAQAGDGIYVSGMLGGAAACVRQKHFTVGASLSLTSVQQRYFRPMARIDVMLTVRNQASACVDISDGFLQDLSHLTRNSGVGAELESKLIPIHDGATLNEALSGGDDYELLCTSNQPMPGFIRVGTICVRKHMLLDQQPVNITGYEHFST